MLVGKNFVQIGNPFVTSLPSLYYKQTFKHMLGIINQMRPFMMAGYGKSRLGIRSIPGQKAWPWNADLTLL